MSLNMIKKILKIVLLIAVLSAAFIFMSSKKVTPEEQLMKEMGDILKEAYGRDTRQNVKKLK